MAATGVPIEVYLLSEYEPDAEYVETVRLRSETRVTTDMAAWQRAIM